jgi:hypothetical protein
MRKKTEPQTPKHPKTSRTEAGKKGLIAKEENLLRSARETCALDDHSHRTPKLSGVPAGAMPRLGNSSGQARPLQHLVRRHLLSY